MYVIRARYRVPRYQGMLVYTSRHQVTGRVHRRYVYTRDILRLYVEYLSHNRHPQVHTQGFIVMYGFGRPVLLIV